MVSFRFFLGFVLSLILVPFAIAVESTISEIEMDGTIRTANGILPISRILSSEAQDAMRNHLVNGGRSKAGLIARYKACGLSNLDEDFGDPVKLLDARHCFIDNLNLSEKISKLKKIHPVYVDSIEINGVEVDVVMPKSGVSTRNKNRVLFYIHGSGRFMDHPLMRLGGSIPAASFGNIKVLGVDHRLAPEGKMADTMADLAAVYSGVLKEYSAENIGIFGCSAGGHFTASMIPYLHKIGLPLPGAIAIQGENANTIDAGDAFFMISGFGGTPVYKRISSRGQDYLDSVYHTSESKIDDPVVEPTRHDSIIKLFPPTIWMNSMRDPTVSRAVGDHRSMLRNGVETELHLWEGLPHCFPSMFPEIPETRDWYEQMMKFFDKHLEE